MNYHIFGGPSESRTQPSGFAIHVPAARIRPTGMARVPAVPQVIRISQPYKTAADFPSAVRGIALVLTSTTAWRLQSYVPCGSGIRTTRPLSYEHSELPDCSIPR